MAYSADPRTERVFRLGLVGIGLLVIGIGAYSLPEAIEALGDESLDPRARITWLLSGFVFLVFGTWLLYAVYRQLRMPEEESLEDWQRRVIPIPRGHPVWLIRGYWPTMIGLGMWTSFVLGLIRLGWEPAELLLGGTALGGAVTGIAFEIIERRRGEFRGPYGWWALAIVMITMIAPAVFLYVFTLLAATAVALGGAAFLAGVGFLYLGWRLITRR